MTLSFVIFFLCFVFRTDKKMAELIKEEGTQDTLKMLLEMDKANQSLG